LIQQYQEKRSSLNADIDRVLAEIEAILENRQLSTDEMQNRDRRSNHQLITDDLKHEKIVHC
jgi:energy-coupling factor transporter ATP-binding protein EcfA2